MLQNKANPAVWWPNVCSCFCLVCGGWGFKKNPQFRSWKKAPTAVPSCRDCARSTNSGSDWGWLGAQATLKSQICGKIKAPLHPSNQNVEQPVYIFFTMLPQMMTCLLTSLGPRFGTEMTFTFVILADWNSNCNYLYVRLGLGVSSAPLLPVQFS